MYRGFRIEQEAHLIVLKSLKMFIEIHSYQQTQITVLVLTVGATIE